MLLTNLLSIFLSLPQLRTLVLRTSIVLGYSIDNAISDSYFLWRAHHQDKYPTRRLIVPPLALPQLGTNKDHGTQFLVCV